MYEENTKLTYTSKTSKLCSFHIHHPPSFGLLGALSAEERESFSLKWDWVISSPPNSTNISVYTHTNVSMYLYGSSSSSWVQKSNIKETKVTAHSRRMDDAYSDLQSKLFHITLLTLLREGAKFLSKSKRPFLQTQYFSYHKELWRKDSEPKLIGRAIKENETRKK